MTSSSRALPTTIRPADRSIWDSRALLRALVVRNIKMRYKRSILGFLWALLNPLLTVVILVGVFRYVFRVTVEQYWAFLLSGYFAWVFVLHTLGACAGVVRDHAYMTRSLAFPSDVLIISTVVARFVEFVAELAMVAIILAVFLHHGIPAAYVALPLVMVLHLAITLAVAYPIAALSVFFTDVQHALPVGLTLLSYLSPVYYPLSFIPGNWQALYRLNPFANVLSMFHGVLYRGTFPAGDDVVRAVVWSGVLLTLGVQLFRWKRAYFAEVV